MKPLEYVGIIRVRRHVYLLLEGLTLCLGFVAYENERLPTSPVRILLCMYEICIPCFSPSFGKLDKTRLKHGTIGIHQIKARTLIKSFSPYTRRVAVI